MLIPLFARVFGVAQSGPLLGYKDCADPSIKPVIMVSFILDRVDWVGYVDPETECFFVCTDIYAKKGKVQLLSPTDLRAIAALRVVTYYAPLLATGGNNPEKSDGCTPDLDAIRPDRCIRCRQDR